MEEYTHGEIYTWEKGTNTDKHTNGSTYKRGGTYTEKHRHERIYT